VNTIPVSTLAESIAMLFEEAYVGPPDDKTPTWFNDNSADAGVFGQIKEVSAAVASISADGTDKPGTSIASHLEHLRWSLANINAAFRGLPYNPNWSESWTVVRVNDAEWSNLCGALKAEYNVLHAAILDIKVMENEYLHGVIALVPHAAYHLATIRQIKERLLSAPVNKVPGQGSD